MKSAIRNPKSTLRTSHYARRTGFTLIELLIVIGIIIVLAAIGIGVGYKLTTASDTEQTKANMALAMNAIEDYVDHFGQKPTYNPAYKIDGVDYSLIHMTRTDSSGNELAEYTYFIDKLKNIDDKFLHVEIIDKGGNVTEAVFIFLGPDKQIIQYYPNKAMGGRPLLIAPGEDGLYGTDATTKADRDAWAKDDIRSDK